MLNPHGIVVIQLLNYTRLLTKQERVVGINRHADKEYVRFYDFLQGQVRFNILEIEWAGDEVRHQLRSTVLRPYTWDVLRKALEMAGCQAVDIFSGLQFTPFDAERSETVMLIGRKDG